MMAATADTMANVCHCHRCSYRVCVCAFFGICISALWQIHSCSICGCDQFNSVLFCSVPFRIWYVDWSKRSLFLVACFWECLSLSINPFLHSCVCVCVLLVRVIKSYVFTMATPRPPSIPQYLSLCSGTLCELHFYFFVSFSIPVKCGVRYIGYIQYTYVRWIHFCWIWCLIRV